MNKDYSIQELSKKKTLKNAPEQISQPIMFSAKDHTVVKLTLSEDGMEAHRKHLREQLENAGSEGNRYSKTCSDLIETDRKWKDTIKPMLTGSGRRWMMRSYKPSSLINEYASLYDEIVQGYQSGTREKYIEDANAENGYRRATLEDELALLNEDFENCLIYYEKQEERNTVLRPAIIKIAQKLEKSGSGHLEFVKKAKQLESEPIVQLPENFVERMHAAAKDFASQYMMRFSQQGSVDVSKLLSDVTIIHLSFLKKDK